MLVPNYIEEKDELFEFINDPTSPYNKECNHPICKMRIKYLLEKIQLLEDNLADLRQKGRCSPGEIKGGVEISGKTG
jgi:hypothetical protein